MKQYILYLVRWQLSTPILAICLNLLSFNTILNTIIANLIGGLIFYWVDKFIFRGEDDGKGVKNKNRIFKADS